jgi:ubiquinone biosynthesis protein
MAAGLRVHIPRPGYWSAEHRTLIRLVERNPERLLPPEVEADEPSRLESHTTCSPIDIDPVPKRTQYRVLWSLSQICRFLFRLLYLRLTGRLSAQAHAAMTRQLFERMSGIWIKAGQLLSLREDLISPEMSRELSSLQYQARGFPPEIARQVIEEDIGKPISSVFAWFEDQPFAAATIAQVHRATLLSNNRAVVVKVMRPDVARSFARDLRFLELLVWVITTLGIAKWLELEVGLKELKALLTEETNFQFEAVNVKRMRKSLKKHDIYVPRLIEQLSHKRVLVLEEVPGVLMSHYLHVRQQDPERAHRWCVLNGIDVKAVARRLCLTALRQILEDNEFHGDLHPGNIMLLSDSRIALLDFGSVGRLTPANWTLYRYSLAALATRDYVRAADLMVMLSPTVAAVDIKTLRRDMYDALSEWAIETEFPTSTYSGRSINGMSDKVSKVMAAHNVPLAWGIMRVGRTLSTLDASLQALDPSIDFMALCRRYYRLRNRRMRTLQGAKATLHSAMVELSTLAADTKLLLGSGIRGQALKFSGVLDTLTVARLTLLRWVQQGTLIFVIVLCEALILSYVLSRWPRMRHLLGLREASVDYIVGALPPLNSLHWLLIIGGLLYIVRMLGVFRKSIARTDR